MEANTLIPPIAIGSNNPKNWIENWQYHATIHKDHTVAYFAFEKENLMNLYGKSPDGLRFFLAQKRANEQDYSICMLAVPVDYISGMQYNEKQGWDTTNNYVESISVHKNTDFASRNPTIKKVDTKPVPLERAKNWIAAYKPYQIPQGLNHDGTYGTLRSVLFEGNETDFLGKYLNMQAPEYILIHLAAAFDDEKVKSNTFIFSGSPTADNDDTIITLPQQSIPSVLDYGNVCPPNCGTCC